MFYVNRLRPDTHVNGWQGRFTRTTVGGLQLTWQEGRNQSNTSASGGIEGKVGVMLHTSDTKGRREWVNGYGWNQGMKCVYFNVRSVLSKAN